MNLRFLLNLYCLLMGVLKCAAESPPLTCNITGQSDGSVFYQLSLPPSSSSCSTSWEDHKGTVITRDSEVNKTLVQKLMTDGVIMKRCHGYLKYTEECDELLEEMICTVNCSSLQILTPRPDPPTVNSTQICLFPNVCVNQPVFWPCAVLVAVLVCAAACWIFKKYCPKLRKLCSYVPANNQMKNGEGLPLNEIV